MSDDPQDVIDRTLSELQIVLDVYWEGGCAQEVVVTELNHATQTLARELAKLRHPHHQ